MILSEKAKTSFLFLKNFSFYSLYPNETLHTCTKKLKKDFYQLYHNCKSLGACMPWWPSVLRHCQRLPSVFHHCPGMNLRWGMWESCQWLGVRLWFLLGTLVSSITYEWLTSHNLAAIWQKRTKILNSKFLQKFSRDKRNMHMLLMNLLALHVLSCLTVVMYSFDRKSTDV